MIIFKDKLQLHSIETNEITREQNGVISLVGLNSEIQLKINNFDQKLFLNFKNIFNEHKDININKKKNLILLDMYYGEEWNI